MEYAAIFEKGNDGSFSGYFPDLPGCVSCADTLKEAKELLEKAAALHIQSLIDNGEPIPKPRHRKQD